MNFKNQTEFHIKGLNQERVLNEISKNYPLSDINRKSKNETTFKCAYSSRKKVAAILKEKGLSIEDEQSSGILYKIHKNLKNFGLIFAIFVCFGFQMIAGQFVLQYEIVGTDKLSNTEIVEFLDSNFSRYKPKIEPEQVEIALLENFKRISFASCMIKGQTLVVNIKEKLMPNELYGSFQPITASKNGKITKIDLISGTLQVKVGDIVKQGDVLVEPFVIDASGNLKKVEAKAEIWADVYNEGSAEHQQKYVEVKRTGKMAIETTVKLFGLGIYTFKEEHSFKMFEVEKEEFELIKNIVLPFKIEKNTIFELEESIVESNFEDVKEKYVEKARKKALQFVKDCDKIKDEFFTLRHLAGVTTVNYCIVTEELIGENYEN